MPLRKKMAMPDKNDIYGPKINVTKWKREKQKADVYHLEIALQSHIDAISDPLSADKWERLEQFQMRKFNIQLSMAKLANARGILDRMTTKPEPEKEPA